MKQRGRILRDANSGSGLISSEGTQYEFKLEGIWKSDGAPVIGAMVEFELDETKAISSIHLISDNQLAKEQADKALALAKEKSAAIVDQAIARIGKPILIATGLIGISWFFLNIVTVQIYQGLVANISFWKILSVVASSSDGVLGALQGGANGGAGMYGFLAILSLLGPFFSQFWKDPRAHLGNCLPLLMMLTVAVLLYSGVQDGLKASAAAAGSNPMLNNMISQMMASTLQAIHIGMGAYLAVPACLYLAFLGLKKFLVAKASAE